MKKTKYIKPEMKWVNIYQQFLMIGLSEKIVSEEDSEEYEEAANEGNFDAYDYYWRKKAWK